MADVEGTLNERQGRYGIFAEGAKIWQRLQGVVEGQPGWDRMEPDQQYAATMILMKLARALNGNPNDTDNWHDIQGYAKLIEDRLLGRGVYAPPVEQAVGDVPAPRWEPGVADDVAF